jgi:flagellar protein FliO/FliZ
MDTFLLLKFGSAFVFVISLMLGLPWILKKTGVRGAMMQTLGKRRLKVVEFMTLDARRRLVLVRRDDKEHLLLLGPSSEVVVEAGIPAENGNVVEFLKEQKNAG